MRTGGRDHSVSCVPDTPFDYPLTANSTPVDGQIGLFPANVRLECSYGLRRWRAEPPRVASTSSESTLLLRPLRLILLLPMATATTSRTANLCVSSSRAQIADRTLTREHQTQQTWTPPPPPSAGPTYAYQQPQYYGSEKPYNVPPPAPQQVVVTPQAAPGPVDPKKNKLGKFGGRMGTVSLRSLSYSALSTEHVSLPITGGRFGSWIRIGRRLDGAFVSCSCSLLTHVRSSTQSEAVHGIFN